MMPAVTTLVHHKTKQPIFSDEIKIQLPPALTPTHNLLFTFFTLEKDKKTKAFVEVMNNFFCMIHLIFDF